MVVDMKYAAIRKEPCQQVHEKTFNITHHQGNANHNETSPHTC